MMGKKPEASVHRNWDTFKTFYEGEQFPGVRDKWTDRKCQLFAVACARRIWRYIPEGIPRSIIDGLELFADGKLSRTDWEHLCYQYEDPEDGISEVEGVARSVVVTCVHDGGLRLASTAASYCRATLRFIASKRAAKKSAENEELAQCDLFRDLIPNPLRPVAFSPDWRTTTATAIASQMYDSREFGAMPVLADALQDAGCENADILDHCRGPGPHVRGCWVVDLVLGKE